LAELLEQGVEFAGFAEVLCFDKFKRLLVGSRFDGGDAGGGDLVGLGHDGNFGNDGWEKARILTEFNRALFFQAAAGFRQPEKPVLGRTPFSRRFQAAARWR